MFDAIVIGGGLAGCSAAIALARHSYQVALMEASTYPRHKVCGEFLSPESVELFKQLDFLNCLQEIHPATIQTVRITASHHQWRGRFPAPALSVSRYALDSAFINHVLAGGVTVHTDTRVTHISGCLKDGFEVKAQSANGRITFKARSVICAYGKHSNLDRQLDRQFSRDNPTYVGLKQHFRGERLFEHIDLHTFPGGYCGISQVENDRTNVCMLVEASVFKKVTEDKTDSIDHFMDWICAHNHEFETWIISAKPLYPKWLTIGGVSLVPKPPIEDDIFFIGDASGMVAPLTGDGMAMALQSGLIVAQILDRYLLGQVNETATRLAYQTAWRKTFQSRLRLGRFLQTFMLRQSILQPGLRLMNQFPALGNWLIANTRDMQLLDR